jgi:hypothetical protein
MREGVYETIVVFVGGSAFCGRDTEWLRGDWGYFQGRSLGRSAAGSRRYWHRHMASFEDEPLKRKAFEFGVAD